MGSYLNATFKGHLIPKESCECEQKNLRPTPNLQSDDIGSIGPNSQSLLVVLSPVVISGLVGVRVDVMVAVDGLVGGNGFGEEGLARWPPDGGGDLLQVTEVALNGNEKIKIIFFQGHLVKAPRGKSS